MLVLPTFLLICCKNNLEEIDYNNKEYVLYCGMGFPVYDGLESFESRENIFVIQTSDSAQFYFSRMYVDTTRNVYGGITDTFFSWVSGSAVLLKIDTTFTLWFEIGKTEDIDSTSLYLFTSYFFKDLIVQDSAAYLNLVDSLKPKPPSDFLKYIQELMELYPDSMNKLLDDNRYKYNTEYLELPDTVE
jgi:hypothetical protein